ncbi:MAG: hypothetical protein JJU21_08490 [Salinarimonas sp.]|nr:hypothetical protein [Salinarimonas sp.]
MPRSIKKTVTLLALDEKYREILLVPISNVPDRFALVHPEDYEALKSEYTGTLCFYADAVHCIRRRSNESIRLARVITGAQDTHYVRHVNLDKFDFRRGNLALVAKKTAAKRKPIPRPSRDYLREFDILGPIGPESLSFAL